MSQVTQYRYADKSSSADEALSSDEGPQLNQDHAILNMKWRQEVKNAQLENQALKERLRTMEEQNKVVSANKGRRKQDTAVSEDIVAFEGELKVCAKRYGLMVNMFPPPAALLKTTLPNPLPPFNTAAQYATTGSQELACLAELYDTLPQHLHHLVPMNRFSNVFSKAVCASRASELNKLRSAAGQIFELPQHYFTILYARDAEPDICRLLGITGKAGELYPLLPPLLFPGNIADRTRKTLFGNWQPIAKTLSCCLKGRTSLSNESRRQGGAPPNAVKWGVTAVTPGAVAWAIVANIFLLSPDQDFPQEGKGKTSRINYSTLYTFLKELLLCDWEKPCLKGIIKHINTFDLADDLQEEMCLAQLGLAAEVEENLSDDEDVHDANIDILTKNTGAITIHESDEVPGPPGPTLSLTNDTVTSTHTVASHCSSISKLQVCDGPVDSEEIEVVIKESNSQAIETTKSKSSRAKKSRVPVSEGDDGTSRRHGRSKNVK
ncbi:uncharacterized protein EDB91DRAFT_1250365 [Suillus paluster]|uniref:uncharacterized protein n=1 Tax=Suillus paluster TaxID=48578 RepID=UPI001B87B3F2|nr:uncharacterized protein EDB91DRAFT_1250365 [Suillus paluster]KAG1735739.1 hypothetical protein EDB91DRAFT_1250365 [Suillus paluster]